VSAVLLDNVCVFGVCDQRIHRNYLSGARMSRPQDHFWSATGVVGLQPPSRTHAPAVTRRQPGEAPFRAWGGQVVAGMGLNSRNFAVTIEQTVWLPTSSGPVAQQPSR
jgi:hypothetical protein